MFQFELRLTPNRIELVEKGSGACILWFNFQPTYIPEHLELRYVLSLDSELKGYITVIDEINGQIIAKSPAEFQIDTTALANVILGKVVTEFSKTIEKAYERKS